MAGEKTKESMKNKTKTVKKKIEFCALQLDLSYHATKVKVSVLSSLLFLCLLLSFLLLSIDFQFYKIALLHFLPKKVKELCSFDLVYFLLEEDREVLESSSSFMYGKLIHVLKR